jgi:putative beta-barrel porin BBP2
VVEGVFVSAAARQMTTAFDSDAEFRGESLAHALNQQLQAIDGTVGVAITPLTSVSVVVSEERQRFDLEPDRDSDTLRIMPTVTFSPLAILSGSAAFGYRKFTTLSPLVPDYHGFVATLSLASTIRERQRIEVTFGRDVQYSYEEDAIFYVETGIQGTWTWQVAGPIDLRVTGGRSRLQYQSPALTAADDDDAAFTYGGGVGWRLREHFKVGVNADWRARDSERSADREFDNRKIYAYVTWGKQ